jgi:hypothetical protein
MILSTIEILLSFIGIGHTNDKKREKKRATLQGAVLLFHLLISL